MSKKEQLLTENTVKKTTPEIRAEELFLQMLWRGLSVEEVDKIAKHLNIQSFNSPDFFDFPS